MNDIIVWVSAFGDNINFAFVLRGYINCVIRIYDVADFKMMTNSKWRHYQPFLWAPSVFACESRQWNWTLTATSNMTPNLGANCFAPMGLLPYKWNCGLRMRRECRERFPPTVD